MLVNPSLFGASIHVKFKFFTMEQGVPLIVGRPGSKLNTIQWSSSSVARPEQEQELEGSSWTVNVQSTCIGCWRADLVSQELLPSSTSGWGGA